MRNLMKKSLYTTVFAMAITPLAQAESYQIDPTHSFVEFSISHLGYSLLQGRFNTMEGRFDYDADNPSAASISITVKSASIDSNHAERDKHLRSADFFDVDNHPLTTFSSTGFRELGDGKAELKGDLTLLGVTKPITVDVTFIGAGDDPWGGYRRGYIGKSTIRRSDFGMSYNLGPAAETVDLEFVIEGVRQQD